MLLENVTLVFGQEMNKFIADFPPDEIVAREPDRFIVRYKEKTFDKKKKEKYHVFVQDIQKMKIGGWE